jgi:hypothetical protein
MLGKRLASLEDFFDPSIPAMPGAWLQAGLAVVAALKKRLVRRLQDALQQDTHPPFEWRWENKSDGINLKFVLRQCQS